MAGNLKLDNNKKPIELTADIVVFAILTAIYELILSSIAPVIGGGSILAEWLREVLIIGVGGMSLAYIVANSRRSKLVLAFIAPGVMAMFLSMAIIATHRSNFILLGFIFAAGFSFLVWGLIGGISVMIEPHVISLIRKRVKSG